MTKLQFISELLGYIKLLTQTDLTPCVANIAFTGIAETFEEYEEKYGETQTSSNRDDLKNYRMIVQSLLQNGTKIYEEEKSKDTTTPTMKSILEHIANNSADEPTGVFASMDIEESCFISEHHSILVSL